MVKRLPGIKNTKHIVCQGRWHKHFLKANFSENLTHIIQSKQLHNYIMTINALIHSVQKIYNGGRIAPEYTDCPFLQQIKKILSL